MTLLTAIAAVTERIGLIATASTTFNEPYNLARYFGSLDHISGGRAGWNIVTTFSEAAAYNFGLAGVPSNEDRYARAQEFVDVTSALWDSWEDGAVLVDRASGHYLDLEKVHRIDHAGRFLKVRGPLNAPRTPQGRPVYIQAGSSNEGRAFAARNAEAIFTAHQTLADAQAFYDDIKTKARGFGRNPDHVMVLPGISPFIADTAAEAEQLYHYFNELTVPAYGLAQLEKMAGIGLGHLELDEPVPAEVFGGSGNVLDNNRSRRQVVANIVERDNPTLREPAGSPRSAVRRGSRRLSRHLDARRTAAQRRGSTGSDSSARTAKTSWCTRHSGAPSTNAVSASRPRPCSRRASSRFLPRWRWRSTSRESV